MSCRECFPLSTPSDKINRLWIVVRGGSIIIVLYESGGGATVLKPEKFNLGGGGTSPSPPSSAYDSVAAKAPGSLFITYSTTNPKFSLI